MATAAEIKTAYRAVVRTELSDAVANAVSASGVALDTYIAGLVSQNASTTGAAVAITSFITGVTPSSTQLDALKVEADRQVASYTALGVGNPQLGAFEAFGRGLAVDSTTTAAFNTRFGALSNADFINVVYAQVYGTTPTAAAFANLSSQLTFFTNLYTQNGVANVALAAKGAVLGQIIGYAFTSSASANSTLDNQVAAVLSAAARGDTTVFSKALPTVVDPAQVGVTITLAAAATDTVNGTAADLAFRSTAGNDTINGALEVADRIDAGNGEDTGNFTLGGNVTVAAGGLVSVETVKVTSSAAATLDVGLATGIKNIILSDSAAATVVSGIGAGVAVSVVDTTPASATFKSTFALKDASGTADVVSLSVNGVAGAGAEVVIADVETINLTSTGVASTFTLTDAALRTLNVSAAKNVTLTLDSTVLETVVATGAGGVALGTVSNTTKSIDGSGLTGTTGLSFTIADGNALTSVKSSVGADNFTITTTGKAFAIDTGAGADTLAYTQSNTTAGAALGAVVTGAGADTVTLTSTGSAAGAAVTQRVTLGTGADTITLADTGNVVTTLVYAGTDSTLTFADTVNGFKAAGVATATAGADRIDVTAYSLGAATVSYTAVALPVADSANLFTGAGTNIIAYATGGGVNSTLLIDANKDGSFTLGTDLAINLVGVVNTDVTAANFAV